MAKLKEGKKAKKKRLERYEAPFTKENYLLFFAGVIVIIVGYIFMAQGPAESFWSLTLSPIILVIGYCILFPLAILYKRKSEEKTVSANTSQESE